MSRLSMTRNLLLAMVCFMLAGCNFFSMQSPSYVDDYQEELTEALAAIERVKNEPCVFLLNNPIHSYPGGDYEIIDDGLQMRWFGHPANDDWVALAKQQGFEIVQDQVVGPEADFGAKEQTYTTRQTLVIPGGMHVFTLGAQFENILDYSNHVIIEIPDCVPGNKSPLIEHIPPDIDAAKERAESDPCVFKLSIDKGYLVLPLEDGLMVNALNTPLGDEWVQFANLYGLEITNVLSEKLLIPNGVLLAEDDNIPSKFVIFEIPNCTPKGKPVPVVQSGAAPSDDVLVPDDAATTEDTPGAYCAIEDFWLVPGVPTPLVVTDENDAPIDTSAGTFTLSWDQLLDQAAEAVENTPQYEYEVEIYNRADSPDAEIEEELNAAFFKDEPQDQGLQPLSMRSHYALIKYFYQDDSLIEGYIIDEGAKYAARRGTSSPLENRSGSDRKRVVHTGPSAGIPQGTITYTDGERTCHGMVYIAPPAAPVRLADAFDDLAPSVGNEAAVDYKKSDDLTIAALFMSGDESMMKNNNSPAIRSDKDSWRGPVYQPVTGKTILPSVQEMGYGAPQVLTFPGGSYLAFSGHPDKRVYILPNPFANGPQPMRPVKPLPGRDGELTIGMRGGVDPMPLSAPLLSEGVWLGYQVFWAWEWQSHPLLILTPNAQVELSGAWSGVLYGVQEGETHVWLEKGRAVIISAAGSAEITGPADGEHLLLATIAADGSIAQTEMVTPAGLAERFGILTNALPGQLSITIEVNDFFNALTEKRTNELAWQLWLDTDNDRTTGSPAGSAAPGAEIFYHGQGENTTCTVYTPQGEAADCSRNPFSLSYDLNGQVVINAAWDDIAALVEAAGSAADASIFAWRVGHVNTAMPGQPADYIP